MQDLTHLADLIRIRNYVNASVSQIIGAPAESGRIAEFVAGQIFAIDLNESFVSKAIDGYFRAPANLAGRSVNVKFRSSSSRRLNLVESVSREHHPDYYLAFRGPKVKRAGQPERMLPFVIDAVYLFRTDTLLHELRADEKTELGPSVIKRLWEPAMIFPHANNPELVLRTEQFAALELFAPLNKPAKDLQS